MAEEIPIYKNLILTDILGEVWVSVKNFGGYYEVSNMGRIKSLARTIGLPNGNFRRLKNKILKQDELNSGYLSVMLQQEKSKKHFRVHRLVADHFIINPFNKPNVNHLMGIKNDNRSKELEWSTQIENISHAIDTGLFDNKGEAHYSKRLKRGKNPKAKKINQYTLEGKLVKCWDCIEDAVSELKIVRSTVIRTGISRGFRWKQVNKKVV